MTIDRIAVVGAGRVGLSLARALVRSGRAVSVLGRREAALPSPLDPVIVEWNGAIAAANLIVLAVADDALEAVATRVAASGPTKEQVVLHTSGLYDHSVLSPLRPSGAALGSWHPLQTFAHPDGEPTALAGSPVAIEGDPTARAAGRELANILHLRPVIEVATDRKAAYHAGAVFASNYILVLADIAARLAREAGAADASGELFLPLMRRTIANYASGGPATLTGPISRGDAGTVARHLAALDEPERGLYVALGKEALRLAIASGLDATKAAGVAAALSATARRS